MSDYRDLKAWRLAVQLCADVHVITVSLPRSEEKALTSQLNRSSLSVVSNIVEGSKKSLKTFIHQLTVAHASAAELETQLRMVAILNMSKPELISQALDTTDHVSRLIFLLRRSMQDRLTA